VSFWADDAIVFPPGSPAVAGKSAIREFVAKGFQTPGFSISWKTTTVAVSRSGDIAYRTGTNRVTFSAPDGKQVTVEGKAVAVWRREKDGAWKCVIDIWNDVSSSR
jgi:ketosteroid isomerase-like protein